MNNSISLLEEHKIERLTTTTDTTKKTTKKTHLPRNMNIPPAPIETTLTSLKKAYPDSKCSLNYNTIWELLVATILSAQATDEKVNQITPILFRKYPTMQDIANAELSELEQLIKNIGLFKRKAKAIKDCAEIINNKFNTNIPKTIEELMTLPGVGRKTANVVLGEGYKISTGIVVDTHVTRLSYRLGWTNTSNPKKIEIDLQKIIPKDEWITITHLLIDHGRAICNARNPKCHACAIEMYCPSSKLKNK